MDRTECIQLSAEALALIEIIKKETREMKKHGIRPKAVRVSPSVFCTLSGEKRHKQYDSEARYGRICGLDVYVDEAECFMSLE